MDEEIKQRRAGINKKISELREQAEKEISKLHEEADEEIFQRRTEIEEELKKRRELDSEKIAALKRQNEKLKTSLQETESALSDLQVQEETEKSELEFEKNLRKEAEDKFKKIQINFKKEVKRYLEAQKKTFESRSSDAQNEIEKLRADLKSANDKLSAYENFQAIYGDEPENLRQKIFDLQKTCDALREEVARRPSAEVAQLYENLKAENSTLQNELKNNLTQIGILQQQVLEVEKLRNENTVLKERCDELQAQVEK